MSPRFVYPFNLLLAVALISCIAYVIGRESAEAQPRPAAQTDALSIGLVDFTRLDDEVSDVQRINELMSLLGELARTKEEYYQRKIEDVQKELEALENYGQQNTPDWDETTDQYRTLIAEFESVKAVTEFRMKRQASVFSARLLDKILESIRRYSSGRFDMVVKVLGDPTEDEIDRLGGALGEQVAFNLARAREVLFFDEGKQNVTDITAQVTRHVNMRNDDQVSKALDEEVARVQAEIEEWEGKE